jgi:hypothetical protein
METIVLAEEKSTIPSRYKPATIMSMARKIEKNRGIFRLRKKITMGSITKARSRAMVKGSTMGAVTFNTAPPNTRAIKATRKKFARPELKLLNIFFITPSMAYLRLPVRIPVLPPSIGLCSGVPFKWAGIIEFYGFFYYLIERIS